MEEKAKPQILSDAVYGPVYDSTSIVPNLHFIKVESPPSELKLDETGKPFLNVQIKSEILDTNLDITSVGNEIFTKPELLETEALYIKTEITPNINDQKPTQSEQGFFCDICDGKFATQANLRRHLKIHSKGKLFQCSICDYKCRGTSMLQRHNLEIHTEEKPFKCSLCDYRCARKNNLPPHMKIHTGEKPFLCTICDYRGAYKTNLQEHMKTHTGEKPFKCSVCDFKFRHKVSLKRHAKTHTGEKPFQCSECEYKCARKSNLQEHMKTHTGEKPFKCSICAHRFTHKISLNRHMDVHSGEKLFH